MLVILALERQDLRKLSQVSDEGGLSRGGRKEAKEPKGWFTGERFREADSQLPGWESGGLRAEEVEGRG